MNKAYKFRLYPNAEQINLLTRTFGCVRFIYNKMLGDKIDYYHKTGKKLSNTPAQYKEEFPWLKEVDSLALANAQLHLQAAYHNFFRFPKAGFPKFKSKHRHQDSYTTNNQKGSIRIEDGRIKLPKIGFVKMKQHRPVPENYAVKSAAVSKTPTGKYFVSVLFEYEEVIQPVKIKNVAGLDFSMKELFVSSDGVTAEYPRYYRQSMEQLQKEQRRLSKCRIGSKNRNKQRIRVAKLHEKISNQRNDFLHKLSRQITNVYDAVCIEDLNMQGMSQGLNLGKSVHDNGWGMFTSFLGYKLSEQGKKLIKIDKWYPSSKTCSCCGKVKEELSLSERTYQCECGFVCDRDVNAARNIRKQGMLVLA